MPDIRVGAQVSESTWISICRDSPAVLLDWKSILLELLSAEVPDRHASWVRVHGNDPHTLHGNSKTPGDEESPGFDISCGRPIRHHLHDWSRVLGHPYRWIFNVEDFQQFHHGALSMFSMVYRGRWQKEKVGRGEDYWLPVFLIEVFSSRGIASLVAGAANHLTVILWAGDLWV